MKKYIYFVIALFVTPLFVHAQSLVGVKGFLAELLKLLNRLVPIVFGIALTFFFYGGARYILKAGSDVERKKGKDFLIWSVVAMFVMVSIWGLILFLQDSFGLTRNQQDSSGKGVIFWDVREKL